MIADRYYFSCLSKREQTIYKDVYQGIKNMEPRISTLFFSNANEIGNRVFSAINHDNPHFFYLDSRNGNLWQSNTESVFEINYVFGRSEVEHITQQCMEKANSIANYVMSVAGSDEAKRERALYTYFCEHFKNYPNDYDPKDLKKLLRAHSMIGPLLDGKGNCDGFAKAYKFILNYMDMKCIYVSGTADSSNYGKGHPHGWNVVKIYGKNYHTDVTWGLANSSPGNVNYVYLDLNDTKMLVDHHPESALPKCSSDDLNHFKASGLQIDNSIYLKNHIKNAMKTRKAQVEFELVTGEGKCGFKDLSNGLQYVQEAIKRAGAEANATYNCQTRYSPDGTIFYLDITYG